MLTTRWRGSLVARSMILVGLLLVSLFVGGSTTLAQDDEFALTEPDPYGRTLSLQSNQPPSVNVGSDQTITLADSLLLDGAVLDDGLPDPPGALTVTWSVVSGPGVVTFSDVSSVDTTATFSAIGTYVLRLTVDDGELSASDQLSITVNSAYAHTIQVPQDQPTIQAGIDAAQDGDLVLVSPGTYNEALTIASKTITLASLFYTTHDEQFIGQTIIDGNGLKVITVDKTAGLQTKIIGFTIQNGVDGISASAKLHILNNRFTGTDDAIDYGSGGGGLCHNNVFENNSDDAIDLDGDSEAIIEDNVIRNNDDDGIEIRLHEYSGPTLNIIIRNNTIAGSGEDGIQLIDYPDVSDRIFLIERNLIAGSVQAGLGLMDNGVSNEDFRAASIPERIHLFNNTFVDNDHGLTGGDNLIALNNLFVNTTNIALKEVDGDSITAYNLFWNNGTDNLGSNLDMNTTIFADPLLDSNAHLQPGSPAIDAGTAQYVLASGEIVLDLPPRAYFGAAPDLGVFESNFTPGNQRPTVDAGPDQTVTLPDSATLDGTVSDDGLPDPPGIVTTTWSQVSGPGVVTFGDASAEDTVASFSTGGVYVLRLTANDGEASNSDEVTITVNPVGGAPIIEEVRVEASSDDAEEDASGSMDLNSSDLELVLEASNQTVGMRFNGIDIPQGATISKAHIQFQTDETNSEATSLSLQGEATDNALTFINTDGNITNRGRTTAAVSWTPAPWTTRGEAGPNQQTPDITSVIQEIVNRPGWTQGNSLVIIITGSGKRVAEAFDGDQAGAPLLHLEYTTGPVNDPPVANDDADVTNEDTLLSVPAPGVLANDTDAENDPLTAVLDGGPANGTLTLNSDGSFTYDPDPDFAGADSFTYTANDGQTDSNVATVSLMVNPVNDAPVAVDDAYTTDEATTLNVALPGVLGNDSDVDGDGLTAALVSEVSNGTLTLNGDGSFSYTPNANFNGADSFTYTVNDGQADSNPAMVSITVSAANDPPVADDLTVTTDEDTAAAITLTGSDPDGDSLTFSVVAGPSNGTLSGTPPDLTYTPNLNYNGLDSFTYTANDGQADSNVATVSLTVNPVNDAPVAVDDAYPTNEGTTLNVALPGVLANDTDVESDPLTAVLDGGPANGILTLNSDGSFTYTPNLNFNGTDSFTYVANDGTADSNAATVTITVNPVGGAPIIEEVRVEASSDDAEEDASGSMDLNSSDLELVLEASNQTVGMRFNGIDIPQGATISKAHIQFQTDETNSEATSLSLQGEATDNALTFINTDGNITNRGRTTAAVSWTPAPWTTRGEAGPNQQTPDITSVIQEIVNRPGWTSGNSLVIIITGTGERVAEAFDGVSSAAPLLHVEYQ